MPGDIVPRPRPRQAPVPPFFQCPISLELMQEPVSLCTGVSYDRPNIERWFENRTYTCPVTRQVLESHDLTPNHVLRRLIQDWCTANRTGLPPVENTAAPELAVLERRKVRAILESISKNNGPKRLAAIRSLKAKATTSDVNKECVTAADAMPVLAKLIDLEIIDSDPNGMVVVQEVLGLMLILPLDITTKTVLVSAKHLTSLCWLLNRGAIEARVQTCLLLQIMADDRCAMATISATDGAIEGVVGLLKDKLNQIATKGSLETLVAFCQSLKIRVKIAQMEVIPLLFALLSESDTSTREQIMALLDTLSSCSEGRIAIAGYPLVVPILVKNISNVQDKVTEHAVSVLWAVCLHATGEEALEEAIVAGALKKVLLLLQVNCNVRTKQRAKDLLRLFSDIELALLVKRGASVR